MALSVERFIAVLAIAAFLITAWLVGRRNDDLRGRETGTLVAGLVGARVLYVLTHLNAYGASPVAILFLWQGGFSAVGALVGGVGWTVWRFRKHFSLVPPALLPILVGLVVWSVPTSVRGLSDAPQPTLPAMSLPLLEGGTVELAALPDQQVVVNIWATWCPPCRREMPMFVDVVQETEGVLFLFLNQGETAKVIQGYLSERGLAIPNIVLDPGSRFGTHFGARALPTTLFFDKGVLVDAHVGEISRAALTDAVQSLRAEN